ncbi:MAG TPA: hypothetical protein VGV69_07735 [Solirubrobacterales bacterium]|nr:hypothetical protein [Solirubrobacterales bacterium]
METTLMAIVVAPEASLSNLLRSMRGEITDARLGFPDVLHVEIRDGDGDLWHLATQDADWSPSDPADLIGRTIEEAEVDEGAGDLRCKLSDGSVLAVKPADRETDDDPPYWEIITPGGAALEFGPGARWQISSADAPAPSAR